MPANLPAEARAKWLKVLEAKTPEEKLKALEEFISATPKHKGTENLIHWARRRMAQLRREIELRKEKERSRGGGGLRIYVEKSGDVQLAVIGPPLSGKSALLKCLTDANVEPDLIPYSTIEPVPGMFIEGNVYFQLVKAPSVSLGKDSDLNNITLSIMRNADGVLMVLNCLNGDVRQQFDAISKMALDDGIYLVKPRGIVRVEPKTGMGVQVIGKLLNATHSDVVKLLTGYRIYGAIVYIDGEATLDDIEDALIRSPAYKPTILILNNHHLCGKVDLTDLRIPIIPAKLDECVIDRVKLSETILRHLDLIKVYTKEPWASKPTDKPFILKRGSTVGDLAQRIHSELYRNFKYARIWSPTGFHRRVGLNYVLNDGDIVEIHA
ncbi:OBG GTPase family GTP-binding protein [Caldivirga maquilingensis]|uniref:TGS domain protein n=1 Tax=Caldivirga maquilingensis (strain ATCC 700844 / DSM 13496 / JCM 10307 / IC-167) TaxID=397948 RepID=A8MDF8_CALMQ|nr:TGS domain-containing protein [Caldivirga maquilingensis]ABW01814.1 TGS domain protein [Caldivirga maquilingensis IC-167]